MLNRRQMFGALSLPALAYAVRPAPGALMNALERARLVAEDEESFWYEIGRAFPVDRSVVNLNNGGVSPAPAYVLEAMKAHLDFSNKVPAFNMWRILEPQVETVRARMARFWKVGPEEVALTRNASEGLQICQFGHDLAAGDEVLTTNQDYPRMISTFRQRERREGIVLRQISLPVPLTDPAEVVRRFEEAITERTRLILVSHMVFMTGQILPVRAIVAMARKRGVPVIVDGAHALAHIDFTLDELDCDFYASSLHKWLFAPHGTGFLYVRRERIGDLWPLMAADDSLREDIRKFEQIGTHPVANRLAIAEALTFHESLGAARKTERLRELRAHWSDALAGESRVRFHTNLEPGHSAAIVTVQLEGLDSTALSSWLWREHRILVTAITHDEFEGLRVSPSVYTTKRELEHFVDALRAALRDGLPA